MLLLAYLSVESSRTQQRGVECVWSVGGHDELHLTQCVEAVHLIEQLQNKIHS